MHPGAKKFQWFKRSSLKLFANKFVVEVPYVITAESESSEATGFVYVAHYVIYKVSK